MGFQLTLPWRSHLRLLGVFAIVCLIVSVAGAILGARQGGGFFSVPPEYLFLLLLVFYAGPAWVAYAALTTAATAVAIRNRRTPRYAHGVVAGLLFGLSAAVAADSGVPLAFVSSAFTALMALWLLSVALWAKVRK
jgi:hypothetical protein